MWGEQLLNDTPSRQRARGDAAGGSALQERRGAGAARAQTGASNQNAGRFGLREGLRPHPRFWERVGGRSAHR